MENQLPVEKSVKDMTLQEYADARCGGDRYRAIYELLEHPEIESFDPYIEEMDSEEASFTLWLVQHRAEYAYGGTGPYQEALKAYTLMSELGLEEDQVTPQMKNPFLKKLLLSLLIVVAGVVVATLASVIGDIAYVGGLLITWGAMDTADAVLKSGKFRKMQKLLAEIPPELKKDYVLPTYEELMAGFRERLPEAPKKEEALKLLEEGTRQVRHSGAWLGAYPGVLVISLLLGYTGMFGGILGCACLAAYFVWQVFPMFRKLAKARDIGRTKGISEAEAAKLQNKQSIYVLYAILIAGAYLILTVIGCFAAIKMTTGF